MAALDAWSRDLDEYFTLYDDAATITGVGPEPMGVTELRAFYEGFQSAFPDASLEVLSAIEEGDELAVHYRVTGTHDGDFQGVPASGNQVAVEGASFMTFRDGKLVDRRNLLDLMGLMIQIGAVPPPG